MGCSIHGKIQARANSDYCWITLEGNLDIPRSGVYALLGNEFKNVYGQVPIAVARGLPTDNICMLPDWLEFVEHADDGLHHVSYLSMEEIFAYDWNQVITFQGWMRPDCADEWELGGKRPAEAGSLAYSKVVKGVKIPRRLNESHVLVEWQVPYSDQGLVLFEVVMKQLAKHIADVGLSNVRIVFGFDS